MTLDSKFIIKSLLKILPRLNRVATLPCEMFGAVCLTIDTGLAFFASPGIIVRVCEYYKY